MSDLSNQYSIVCIGGMNVDRKFYAKSSLQNETSNPVTSSYSVGGVARNIAENLGRLGEKVSFISVGGRDGDYKVIYDKSAPYMDLSFVKQVDGAATGSYTAVLDQAGDMAIAYADMEVFDQITPDLIQEHEQLLLSADCLVIDLNCPLETVEYIHQFGKDRDIPLVIIPVSSPKMDRLPKELSGLTWLIVNKDETEGFLNHPIENKKDWKESVKKWLDLGIENVVVTMGEEGVMAGSRGEEVVHFPAVHTPVVVDVTGAGDSFCSAVIHTWLQAKPLKDIIHAGRINAHRTIMSEDTVRIDLSRNQLIKDMKENK